MAPTSAAPQLDDDNPWPGLDSYTEVAQHYFHGRDNDSADLLRLIRMSPFVMLYGKSGLGKSSMLQAGVFPQLRAARLLPVYLRLDYTEAADQPPLQQALARVLQEAASTGCDVPQPTPGEGLWAYLQRRERPIWTRDNFPVTPVLVFDQFEEIFSRGGSLEHVKRMLDDIAALAGDRPLSELGGQGDAAKLLNLLQQQYRIVLSFRSDFLAEVLSWAERARLPKYEVQHLEAMTREIAIDAVERAGAAVLEPGVAAQIVDFVLGRADGAAAGAVAKVEPVLLSLCCYQLNSQRQRPARIDSALLRSVGEDILLDFYNEALAGTEPRVSVFIEDNLIQGGRYRSSFPREEALSSGLLTADELDLLQKRRLLRVDPQGDVPRIELIHDRLVGIVRDAREARRARRQAETLRLEAEQRAQREREGERLDKARLEAARVKRGRNGLAAALVVFAVLAVNLWFQTNRANTEADRAKASAKQAEGLALQAFTEREAALKSETAARKAETQASSLAASAAEGETRARQQESEARRQGRLAGEEFQRAQAYLLGARSASILVGTSEGSDRQAFQQLLVGRKLLPGADTESALFDALVARQHLRGLDPLVIKTGSAPVSLAISPDSRWLAAGHDDGSISLRDLGNPQADPRRVPGHQGSVQSIAFSADGARLVTAGNDTTVRLWRVEPLAAEGAPLRGHTGSVYSAAFSPDGAQIASGGAEGVVRLWNAVTGQPQGQRESPESRGAIWAVAYNPRDAKKLAVATGMREAGGSYIALFDTDKTDAPKSFYSHGQDTLAIGFSPSGRNIVSGGRDDTLRVRDLTRPATDPAGSVRIGGHQDDVWAVAFSPDGRWAASGSADTTVRLWRAGSGEPLGLPLVGHSAPVTGVAFSPDGRWLVSSSLDGTLRLWPLTLSWTPGATEWPAAVGVRAVALGRDGHLAVLALEDEAGTLLLRDDALPAERRLLAGSELALPPRPAKVPCLPRPEAAESAYGARGSNAIPEKPPISPPRALALRADGQRVATVYDDGSLRQWDLGNLQAIGPVLQISACALVAVAWSDDGERLAVIDVEGKVIVINPRGDLLDTPRSAAGASVLAFSRGGDRLALAGVDRVDRNRTRERPWLRLLYPGRGAGPAFEGAFEAISTLAFSPDGAQIVSGSKVGHVRVWDAKSGRALTKPQAAHTGVVAALAFAADGQRFVSAGKAGVPRPWPAPPAAWAGMMCDKLGSNLSRAAWDEWVSRKLPYRCPCPGLPIEADDPKTAAKPEICPAIR